MNASTTTVDEQELFRLLKESDIFREVAAKKNKIRQRLVADLDAGKGAFAAARKARSEIAKHVLKELEKLRDQDAEPVSLRAPAFHNLASKVAIAPASAVSGAAERVAYFIVDQAYVEATQILGEA